MQRQRCLSFAVRGLPICISSDTFCFLVGILLLAWIFGGRSWHGTLLAGLFVLLTYLSGIVHELAHALAARHFGMTVAYIRLSAMGLFAGIREDRSKRPHEGFIVALSGLAASTVLGLIFAAVVVWAIRNGHPLDLASIFINGDPHGVLCLIAITNLAAALINLVPILPTDGSKMLHAVLVHFMPACQAQRIIVLLGQFLAITLVVSCAWPMPATVILCAVATASWIFRTSRHATIASNRSVRRQASNLPLTPGDIRMSRPSEERTCNN